MNKSVRSIKVWGLRCTLAVVVVASLAAGAVTAFAAEVNPPVPSDSTVLSSSTSISKLTCTPAPCTNSTITANFSGVPVMAWSSVQWQDTAGIWHDVETWQGKLDIVPNSGVPFKKWTVLPDQFGKGPFRWVVYSQQGGTVWGISPSFTLPKVAGEDLAHFLNLPGTTFMKPTSPDMILNPPVPTTAPVLSAQGDTNGFTCGEGLCDHSNITIFIPTAPRTAWVTVQWIDVLGNWHDVEGWQGNIDIASGSNLPFKQWSVFGNAFNQGPFRWVVYNQRGGEVWGVSPNFNLPKWGGLNMTTFLSPQSIMATGPG